MIRLLNKYGNNIIYKKCELFKQLSLRKDVFIEDGFDFKINNEEMMFKYEVVLNGIFNKNKIDEEYKRFIYETQDAISYLNYDEKQKMFNRIVEETINGLKYASINNQTIIIPYLESFINERYLNNYMLLTLKQHSIYVKDYKRDINSPYLLYSLKILDSSFSSLIKVLEDNEYEYYYFDELKKIYLISKENFNIVNSFPIVDKYFQGNTNIDEIKQIMLDYHNKEQFINHLHDLKYLSDKRYKKIIKKVK